MNAILDLIIVVLELYKWCLIGAVILSWLNYANVINASNQFVYLVSNFLFRITEPALRPIQRWIPNFGGLDISPIILILVIWFVQRLINEDLRPII